MVPQMTRLPPDVLEFFKMHGARGGRIGGRRSLVTMTADERRARALKASKAAVVARKKAATKTK